MTVVTYPSLLTRVNPRARFGTMETAKKIEEILASEPWLTQAEVARRLGITRQRVGQLIPNHRPNHCPECAKYHAQGHQ